MRSRTHLTHVLCDVMTAERSGWCFCFLSLFKSTSFTLKPWTEMTFYRNERCNVSRNFRVVLFKGTYRTAAESGTWESLPAWGTERKEREVEYGCVRRIEWGQGEGERETVLNDHKLLLPLGATHTAYHRGTGAWPQHGSLHQSLGAVLCFKVTLTGGNVVSDDISARNPPVTHL